MKNTIIARCKFKLTKVESFDPSTSQQLEFRAQYDKDCIDDKSFCDATPSGTLTAVITNQEILPKLQIGKKYFVEIHEIEDAA